MVPENQENMQNRNKPSIVSVNNSEVLPRYFQHGGNFEERSSNPNEENSSYFLGSLTGNGLFYTTNLISPTEGYYVTAYPLGVYDWQGYHTDNQKAALQNQFYQLANQYYIANHEYYGPDDNQQYAYANLGQSLYQPLHSAFRSQEFQYFVVIDFEATCEKEKNLHPQEIIEFPSVLVNGRTGQLEDQFQVYVRPTHNKQLSDFCKELTGIQQTQVDKGVILSEALFLHDKWLEEKGVKQTNFAVVTWSNWDCRIMLESECQLKKIRKPQYFNRWINLRVPFFEVFGGKRCNLKEAVELAGLSWEGRAHCGLDDAKNTARLLTNLLYRGIVFTITNSLTNQPSLEIPMTPQQPCERPTSISVKQPHRGNLKSQVGQGKEQQPQQQQEHHSYCHCGVKSRKLEVLTPGGDTRYPCYACGKWTVNGGVACGYLEWATH